MDKLDFDYIVYDYGKKDPSKAQELFSIENVKKARKFHREIPDTGYNIPASYAIGYIWLSYRTGFLHRLHIQVHKT